MYNDMTLQEMRGFFVSMWGVSQTDLETYIGKTFLDFGADEVDKLKMLLIDFKTGALDANDFVLTQMQNRLKSAT
jgi:hypothetical protein